MDQSGNRKCRWKTKGATQEAQGRDIKSDTKTFTKGWWLYLDLKYKRHVETASSTQYMIHVKKTFVLFERHVDIDLHWNLN